MPFVINGIRKLIIINELVLMCVAIASADERNLIEHLFDRQNYNPLIRPVENMSQRVKVRFEMSLIQLITLVRCLPSPDIFSMLPTMLQRSVTR